MRVIWLSLLSIAACTSNAGGEPAAGSATASADAAPEDQDNESPSTTADSGVADASYYPVWLTVSGEVVVLAGVPDPLTSELRLGGLDGYEAPLCEAVGPPAAFVPVAPEPRGLLAWWDVVAPSEPGCYLPTTLRLGVGPYDALLDPFVDAAGIAGSPYGLYTAGPDDALWVFGVAGTLANFDGSEGPLEDPPLPDGTYRIESLVLLPP